MSGSKNYGIVPAPHLGESWDYRHHPGEGAQWPGVCPSTGECPHLILEGAETTGTTQRGCPATRSAPSDQGVCSSTRECPHLISEGAETTGTTLGRVPSDRECAQRLGVCPATRSVPSFANDQITKQRERNGSFWMSGVICFWLTGPRSQVSSSNGHVGWVRVQRAGLLSISALIKHILVKDLLHSWQVGFPTPMRVRESVMKTAPGTTSVVQVCH